MVEIELVLGADNGNPPDDLSQMYPKVNRNFTRVNEKMGNLDVATQAAHAAAEAAQTSANQAQTAADAAQDVADAAQAAIAGMDERIDNIVAQSGDDITEIVDARQPATGVAYPTIKNRLDASDNRITVSASPPSTPISNAIWYEDLGESPDLGGGGLVIANAALDGSQDIWFEVAT